MQPAFAVGFAALLAPPQEPARQDAVPLGEIVIEGRADSLIGIASAANEGKIGAQQLAERPLLRPGELLETVPGVVVTQHSGAGKANQYFVRGFNLDHGTDLRTSLDGVPINLPTHGHGQGYTDLNFLIPELVEGIAFKKGPYFADEGDFASAGAVDLQYVKELPSAFAILEGGSYGYGRGVFADSPRVGDGHLLYAGEFVHSDGPWEHPDDFEKFNGVVSYSRGSAREGSSLTLMGYHGEWDATDQVAERAVDSGLIDRFGTLDSTSGGASQRYALSGEWHTSDAGSRTSALAYVSYYDLQLYSNFTYFLNDPLNGDQFLQRDQRVTTGIDARHQWFMGTDSRPIEHSLGLQGRADFIDNGLFNTQRRQILSTTRKDEIVEPSIGLFYENRTQWAEKFRTVAGLRGDFYSFDVDSDNPVNSGTETDAIASPKLSLIFGPFGEKGSETELFVNGGFGFHSNDGRGVTTTDDPSTPALNDAEPVDPLVRSKGAEIGVRTLALEGLQSTLSLWLLELDSELLFVGDAGTTEPSRPSRRVGVEFANYYTPKPWLAIDADASFSHARFTDDDPADDHIPGAIESVVAAGVTLRESDQKGWYGSLRARYFGPRSLIEDDSVRSSSSTLFNAEVGYRMSSHWSLTLEALNLFDADVNDIEYYYPSLLAGEPPGPDDGGYNDIHFHPAEPFQLRLGLRASF